MVTRYSNIKKNSEVMDVLYYIILGRNTVKELKEVLKQPQSTISTKLRFLRQNKIISKNKWNFEPNWDEIYKIMYAELRKLLDFKTKKRSVKPEKYVNKKILKGILKVYSLLFSRDYGKYSIRDMLDSFLDTLSRAKDNDLKKMDKNLLVLKKVLGKLPSEEELLLEYLQKNVK